MMRILLILVTVTAINSLAWGLGYYDAATDMGRNDWSPVAKTAVSMGGKASRLILKPFYWIGGGSPSMLACGVTILLETAIIEVALRLFRMIPSLPQQQRWGW